MVCLKGMCFCVMVVLVFAGCAWGCTVALRDYSERHTAMCYTLPQSCCVSGTDHDLVSSFVLGCGGLAMAVCRGSCHAVRMPSWII
jgi:hypothetical protein